MNAKTLSFVMTVCALLSMVPANAQIINSTGLAGTCGTVPINAPLFGRHTWFDSRFLGAGYMGYGAGYGNGRFAGLGNMLGFGYGGGSLGYGPYGGLGYGQFGGYGVNTMSAVIGNGCGAAIATPVSGQRLANSLMDFRVFGFGLGLGRVSPRWDKRPAGWAL
jgi:hypothetical protein